MMNTYFKSKIKQIQFYNIISHCKKIAHTNFYLFLEFIGIDFNDY